MAISVVTSSSTPNTTNSVTVTLPVAPAADDVIVISVNGIVNGAVDTPPAGWTNVLGEGVLLVPGDSSVCMAVLWHVVTVMEATANTMSWTLSGFWTGPRSCDVQAVVLRGVDLDNVVKAVGTVTNASNSTTHVLPAVDGVDVPADDDLVLSAVMADDLSTYTTPAGYTQDASSNVYAGSWLGHRDALTSASTTIVATNITASLSGESAAFTLVVGAAGGGSGPNDGTVVGAVGWAGNVTGARESEGSAAAAIEWAVSVTGTAEDVFAGDGVTFTGVVGTFEPWVTLAAGSDASVEWRDSSDVLLATGLTPSITAPGDGVVAMRVHDEMVQAIDDVEMINCGYDNTQDAGRDNLDASYNWPPQSITGVAGLTNCTGLLYFMAAESGLTGELDLTGLAALTHVECYQANVTSVVLDGCDSMIRLCLEQNDVTGTVDLTPVAGTLQDLRCANQLNGAASIAFVSDDPMTALWHYCVRVQDVTQHIPMAQLPVVEQWWVWNTGITTYDAPISAVLRSVIAYDNPITAETAGLFLETLNALGASTGNLRMDDAAPPPASTDDDRAALVGRGWSVTMPAAAPAEGWVSGAIEWSGDVAGEAPPVDESAGSVTGSIAWSATVSGSRASEGSLVGGIGWVATVMGEAPDVSEASGEIAGQVAWAVAVTGIVGRSGAVTGNVAWSVTVAGTNGEGPSPLDSLRRFEMSDPDLRAGQLRIYVTPGLTKMATATWTNEDGTPYDLTGKAVSLWVGGSVEPDVNDLTGATEIVGAVDENVVTFTVEAAASLERQALRLTVDSVVEAFDSEGWYPLPFGKEQATTSDVAVQVVASGPPGPPASTLDLAAFYEGLG